MAKLSNLIKRLRSRTNFWVAGNDPVYLRSLRDHELSQLLDFFPSPPSVVLDFGAGSGAQARRLQELGYKAIALDVQGSNYAAQQVFDVDVYDGREIPLTAGHCDAIFASNVLEHIPDLQNTLAEFSRVTSPEAVVVLLMPSPAWRFWISITDIVRSWHFSKCHGVHSKSILHELVVFRSRWWTSRLNDCGWYVCQSNASGLFYR